MRSRAPGLLAQTAFGQINGLSGVVAVAIGPDFVGVLLGDGGAANDHLDLLAQAGLQVRFKFDGKGAIGLNDGEASGGQQVMKSLVLLIGLLKSEDGSGGFVFIDEPFAHLDIRNIQLVGEFLKNTDAQYLMTTPLTHNTDVYDPSDLTLITSKKKKDTQWAQPIFVLQRRQAAAA